MAGMDGLAGGGRKKTDASSSAFSKLVLALMLGLVGLGLFSHGILVLA